MKDKTESQEQQMLIAACEQLGYPYNMIYHCPNGGSRMPIEAAKLVREGVKAGVPDLFLPLAREDYHGLYIEMKVGKGRLSKKQKEWLGRLEDHGYKCQVCYSGQEALGEIKRYVKSVY